MPQMRSSSAPPVRNRTAIETDGPALSHTNGCGGASPTSRSDVLKIRQTLINTWLHMMPLITVTAWKGHAYFAVWWNPLPGSPLSIMQPERWHTTVLRAWPSSMSLDQLMNWCQQGEAIANAILRVLTPDPDADGSLLSYVVPPTWENSWNFGVPPQVAFTLKVTHLLLRSLCRVADPTCFVIEDTDSHISWH